MRHTYIVLMELNQGVVNAVIVVRGYFDSIVRRYEDKLNEATKDYCESSRLAHAAVEALNLNDELYSQTDYRSSRKLMERSRRCRDQEAVSWRGQEVVYSIPVP